MEKNETIKEISSSMRLLSSVAKRKNQVIVTPLDFVERMNMKNDLKDCSRLDHFKKLMENTNFRIAVPRHPQAMIAGVPCRGHVLSTVHSVEQFYRKEVCVPVRFITEVTKIGTRTVIFAHRKTHKRVEKYFPIWKPINVQIGIEHSPWKELRR